MQETEVNLMDQEHPYILEDEDYQEFYNLVEEQKNADEEMESEEVQ